MADLKANKWHCNVTCDLMKALLRWTLKHTSHMYVEAGKVWTVFLKNPWNLKMTASHNLSMFICLIWWASTKWQMNLSVEFDQTHDLWHRATQPAVNVNGPRFLWRALGLASCLGRHCFDVNNKTHRKRFSSLFKSIYCTVLTMSIYMISRVARVSETDQIVA